MKIEIIPAIDLLDGACVRLTQGDYATSRAYSGNPVEVARRFERMGMRRLHLVDLNGARGDGMKNFRVLERIRTETRLRVDFSGGLRRTKDVEAALEAGAERVCVGSVAQRDEKATRAWMERFSPERVMIGIDVKDGWVYTDGWRTRTETTVDELMRRYLPELRHVVCTDIGRDGMLKGAAVGLYRWLCREYPSVGIVASGGVASLDDVRLLEEAGVKAVVVGKAFYERLADFQNW